MNNYKPAFLAVASLGLFLAASIWLIVQYVNSERERDMFNWQDRLSILAETQKRSLEEWLAHQTKNLTELAENPLTQIFVSMEEAADEHTEVERGQVAHLRNLLVATAKRSGQFAATPRISSGLAETTNDGIAIVDANVRVLISTRNFPKVNDHMLAAVERAGRNRRAVIHGIYRNEYRDPRLIIAVPVSRVQAVSESADIPGFAVAVINPERSLYALLSQHWLTTSTDEAMLVGGNDNSTVFLSPLRGGYRLFHTVAASNEALAANFARIRTGGFDQRADYRGNKVLVTGRSIDNTSWILVQKIDASEALRESTAYRDFIHTVFVLVLFIITLAFVAIWRHATSVRLRKTSERLAHRTALLNAVADNISDHILLLDANENIIFINRGLADSIGVHVDDVVGRPLQNIFSVETAGHLAELRQSGEQGKVRTEVMKLSIAASEHDYHVALVSLMQGEYEDSLLFVLHDITELNQAQSRHNRLLEGIITTLVRATDMHDPHCANHSERTRDVTVAIARAMGLPEDKIEVLSRAALLANIGKLYLPREILTKHEALTEEEEHMLQQQVTHAADILRGLDFEGPVIDIIQQKNERPDGAGYPLGLTADEIMQEAKIIAVANAFVAMSSSRAYRPGLPVDQVISTLLEQADTAFDRNVIAALFHVAENQSDWENWQTVQVSD